MRELWGIRGDPRCNRMDTISQTKREKKKPAGTTDVRKGKQKKMETRPCKGLQAAKNKKKGDLLAFFFFFLFLFYTVCFFLLCKESREQGEGWKEREKEASPKSNDS